MPPRRSARPKATVAAESAAEVPATPPPKKARGKKRARSPSDDEGGAGADQPAKKAQAVGDGMPRRKDGTAFIVPVDPSFGNALGVQVYVDGKGEVYDAMLNQTNAGSNNNKFYILQLLHPKGDTSNVILFTKWGRVGENGATQMKGPWDADQAVKEFCKQFKSKAAADFSKRRTMIPKAGKYTWLEREYEDEGAAPKTVSPKKKNGNLVVEEDLVIPDSTLPAEVQDLVRFIFDKSHMNATLQALNYDANKLPLGKLGESTITAGFQALKDLAEVIETPNGERSKGLGGFKNATEQLTNRFYTVIPHAFGRKRPPIIDSLPMVKNEIDLLDSLSDMEIATKITLSSTPKDEDGKPINPLDVQFASLGLEELSLVDPKSDEFKAVDKYSHNTNEGLGYQTVNEGMKVHRVFRVERKGELARFESGGWNDFEGERMLLWHGSRTTNFVGILSTGLRIAPPEAPVTGYEFGKGVYFGDMFGISANYTHFYLSNNMGILLLCEVVAKPFHEAYEFDFHADKTSKGNQKIATKALGKLQHEDWIDAGDTLGRDDLKGCIMPGGKAKDLSSTFPRPSVKVEDCWNEYIIYDVSQVKIRYLLQVQFK
ncbi:PARP-domain-containing protein [Atractiella rhizophila]|nr:PARP-domain-containing protein [Atractiella rhizophila]